jgi:hypothetical protein
VALSGQRRILGGLLRWVGLSSSAAMVRYPEYGREEHEFIGIAGTAMCDARAVA